MTHNIEDSPCYQDQYKNEEFYILPVLVGQNEKGKNQYEIHMNPICDTCPMQQECSIISLQVAGFLPEDMKLKKEK